MRTRKAIVFVLRLAVTVGISYWVWNRLQVSDEAPLEQMKLVPVWAMVLPALVILVNTLIHAIRLQILFSAASQPIPLVKLLNAILKGHFVGLVLPMGGADLVKVTYLSKLAGGASLAAGILGLARLLEMMPWGMALIIGGGVLLDLELSLGILALGCGVLLLVVCGVGIWLSQRNLSAVFDRTPRLKQFVRRLEDGLHQVGRQLGPLVWVTLLGIGFLMMNTFCLWGLCIAYQSPLTVLEVFTLFPLIDFLVSLPISLNGVGIRETVYPMLLKVFEFKLELALAVAWTRWTGELCRAALGGVLFWMDRIPH